MIETQTPYNYEKDHELRKTLGVKAPQLDGERERAMQLTELSWKGDYTNDPAHYEQVTANYEATRADRLMSQIEEARRRLIETVANIPRNKAVILVAVGALAAESWGIAAGKSPLQEFHSIFPDDSPPITQSSK